MQNSSDSTIIKISLPLLVRDWLKKRCPKQECFFIREICDLGIDFNNKVTEETISELDVESKSYVNQLIEDNSGWVRFDYTIHVTKTDVIVSSIWGVNRYLDWRAPSFWQQLGKVLKCPH